MRGEGDNPGLSSWAQSLGLCKREERGSESGRRVKMEAEVRGCKGCEKRRAGEVEAGKRRVSGFFPAPPEGTQPARRGCSPGKPPPYH